MMDGSTPETPLGPCMRCEEPVLPSEADKFVINALMHIECAARGIIGSVAHIERRCSCYVPGSEEDDPPGMTPREAARAAFLLNLRRHQ